jgi:hypothetical protein
MAKNSVVLILLVLVASGCTNDAACFPEEPVITRGGDGAWCPNTTSAAGFYRHDPVLVFPR